MSVRREKSSWTRHSTSVNNDLLHVFAFVLLGEAGWYVSLRSPRAEVVRRPLGRHLGHSELVRVNSALLAFLLVPFSLGWAGRFVFIASVHMGARLADAVDGLGDSVARVAMVLGTGLDLFNL